MTGKMLLGIGAAALFAMSAVADDGHKNNNGNGNGNNNNGNNQSVQSGLMGSLPGTTIGGIASGGAPWVLNQGQASVSSDGRIQVELQGLLIAAGGPTNLVGTTGPVTMVGASLVCGGSGGAPAPVPATGLSPSPLSSSGSAQIDQLVTIPSPCFAPVVLVRIFTASAPLGSQLGAFIAASAINPNLQNQNQNGNGNGNNNGNNNNRGDGNGGGDH